MTPKLPVPAIPHSRLVTSKGVFGALYTEAQMLAYRDAALQSALSEVLAERDALQAKLNEPVKLSEWQELVAERDALAKVVNDALKTLDAGYVVPSASRTHKDMQAAMKGQTHD